MPLDLEPIGGGGTGSTTVGAWTVSPKPTSVLRGGIVTFPAATLRDTTYTITYNNGSCSASTTFTIHACDEPITGGTDTGDCVCTGQCTITSYADNTIIGTFQSPPTCCGCPNNASIIDAFNSSHHISCNIRQPGGSISEKIVFGQLRPINSSKFNFSATTISTLEGTLNEVYFRDSSGGDSFSWDCKLTGSSTCTVTYTILK